MPRSTRAMFPANSAPFWMGSHARLGITCTSLPVSLGNVAKGGVNCPSTAAALPAMEDGPSMAIAPVPKPSS